MNNKPVTIITFDPPLPCLIYKPENNRSCGEPATAGCIKLFPNSIITPSGNAFHLLPICPACAKGMAELYGIDAGPQS